MGRLAILEEDSQVATTNSSDQNKTQNNTAKNNSRKGGGVSDESGYYEGDELPNDDSIEIVYVNQKSTANNEVSITPIIDGQKASLASTKLASEHPTSATSTASQGKPWWFQKYYISELKL